MIRVASGVRVIPARMLTRPRKVESCSVISGYQTPLVVSKEAAAKSEREIDRGLRRLSIAVRGVAVVGDHPHRSKRIG